MGTVRDAARPLYINAIERSPTLRILYYLARPKTDRTTDFVEGGYEDTWGSYRTKLDTAKTIDEWICIPGWDNRVLTRLVNGRAVKSTLDTNKLWIDEIETTIRTHFPKAESITEYGCGVGRNLIALQRRLPHLRCYGYELAQDGVDVAREAVKKFGLKHLEYAKLDYINDDETKYVHPKTDLSVTIFSLEQVPYAAAVGVKHMLDHARLGTIHVEPVPEKYPSTYLGMLGRIYSNRVDYLRNFDRITHSFGLTKVHSHVLSTSQNPLMHPSVYALVK